MTDTASGSEFTHAERPTYLRWLAWLGYAGCVSLILGTIAGGMVVPGHDWVADTISDLGAGRWEIIMDVALYGFATGIFALALAASHAHLGRRRWSAAVVGLALTGALVVVVGARNEYGDGDNEGVVIHVYLVYGLGFLFTAVPLLMADGVRDSHPHAARLLLALGLLWAVASPIFFFMPDDLDGLYERGLGLIACAILATLAHVFSDHAGMAQRRRPS